MNFTSWPGNVLREVDFLMLESNMAWNNRLMRCKLAKSMYIYRQGSLGSIETEPAKRFLPNRSSSIPSKYPRVAA
jgi:hypothetical protein